MTPHEIAEADLAPIADGDDAEWRAWWLCEGTPATGQWPDAIPCPPNKHVYPGSEMCPHCGSPVTVRFKLWRPGDTLTPHETGHNRRERVSFKERERNMTQAARESRVIDAPVQQFGLTAAGLIRADRQLRALGMDDSLLADRTHSLYCSAIRLWPMLEEQIHRFAAKIHYRFIDDIARDGDSADFTFAIDEEAEDYRAQVEQAHLAFRDRRVVFARSQPKNQGVNIPDAVRTPYADIVGEADPIQYVLASLYGTPLPTFPGQRRLPAGYPAPPADWAGVMQAADGFTGVVINVDWPGGANPFLRDAPEGVHDEPHEEPGASGDEGNAGSLGDAVPDANPQGAT